MAYQRFAKFGRSYVPNVSIWSRGQIGISVGAMKKYELEKFNYTVLLYDKDENKIGFIFTNNENEEGAIQIRPRKSGIMIGAKPFLDYYEIEHNETKKYILKRETHNGETIYAISLNEQNETTK